MVFQSFNLFAHKTILDNVTLAPLKVRKTNKSEAQKQALELLLGGSGSPTSATSTPLSSPAASSSAGDRPRAGHEAEGDAVRRTDLGAGPGDGQEVLDVMTTLAREGMTMLVVTHEMGFARRAATG